MGSLYPGKTAMFICLAVTLSSLSCNRKNEKAMNEKATIKKEHWGKLPDGKDVFLYTLANPGGMMVKITNYGGIVTSVITPDNKGKPGDVVLGFDSLSQYLAGHPYFGSLVGRYANRIAGGAFTLDGITYKLATNDGKNHLHGGITGFDKVLWDAEMIDDSLSPGLRLTYLSRDGEEGYPGTLKAVVTYRLTDDNALDINYSAITDQPTVINLTHHSYFNLAGKGDILGHELMIAADKYTPVNEALIPSGGLAPVNGSPMDFTLARTIGERISQVSGGYDHNYVLDKEPGAFGLAARVTEASSGRMLEVYTNQPGLQFYSGNFLDGTLRGKGGRIYARHNGFCLEAQHFPDSPNQTSFPPVVLRPGMEYTQHTVYRFGLMQ